MSRTEHHTSDFRDRLGRGCDLGAGSSELRARAATAAHAEAMFDALWPNDDDALALDGARRGAVAYLLWVASL